MGTMSKNWFFPILILVVAVVLEFVHAVSPYEPLRRAGTLLVIWGVIIEVKYVLRITGDVVYTETETLAVGKSPRPSSFRDHIQAWMNHAGLIWIILGTAIGGFGDLFHYG